jgi:nickel/cobalt transporter (NicO) family protein
LTQLLLGSLLLSVIHAFIPNHWLPLVAVAKVQRWKHSEALFVTALTALAHASSTIMAGAAVGMLGYGLSTDTRMTSLIPPIVLAGLGLVYLAIDTIWGHGEHHHVHDRDVVGKGSKVSLIASLCLAMFFSPCLEIEAFYLKAGFLGWGAVVTVSLVYLVTTVIGMLFSVNLALRGARRIRSHYLEHHERRVTGLVLIALGVVAFLGEL